MQLNGEMTRNRAEEYGFDLWKEFVIPPYFPQLKLMESEKPQIIEGGRGSGKTMLLRYLCHETQFSIERDNIPIEDYHRIGIYWKMDIPFASLMNVRGATDDLWINAFQSMAVMVLSCEILDSLHNIMRANNTVSDEILQMDYSELKGFDDNIPSIFSELKPYIHKQYIKFQSWVSNYKKREQPIFYPMYFLKVLINVIRNNVSLLKKSFYCVYLDEYENLNVTQKKIVNTWLKQSQTPLIFNIAMKHQAFDVADTLSDEKIVEIHDYRKIDLDMLLDSHFATFASEIFLLKVHRHLYPLDLNEEYLYDTSINTINIRTGKDYGDRIKKLIETIFPKVTDKEVANIIFENSVLRKRLLKMIEKDYEFLNKAEDFNRITNTNIPAEALIVLHALLNRSNIDINEVYKELHKYCNKQTSKFNEWIHTNLFGCLLNFYGKLNRICPLYAGYDTFITMSKDNIRHFLELCYSSLSQSENWNQLHRVDVDDQIIAVKSVSQSMLSEIKRFGAKGNVLYAFSIRLGNLFEELRKRDSQSEPEQNQFSISGSITNECRNILRELVKWSVLYESKLTKQKGKELGVEYQFNPIYSAYFTISYRKKRRIELTSNDIINMCSESDVEYNKIIKRFTAKFANKEYINTPSLFD